MPEYSTRKNFSFSAVSPLVWALVAFLLLSAVYASCSGATYILIEDNLDTELTVPWLLTRNHVALDYDAATQLTALMNGVPRNALRPGLNVSVGLFALLDPLPAYLLNQLLVRLAGLVGMYLLLRKYALPQPGNQGVAAVLALAWAVLPVFSMFGVTVLGQPWVVLSFLRLRQGRAPWYYWLPLLIFPLWSNLVLGGAFVLAEVGVGLAWDAWRTRRVPWAALMALALMAGLYLVVEYPLVSALLKRQFVPHRLEFDFSRLSPSGVKAGLTSSLLYFFVGQYHASLFLRLAPLLAVGLAVAVVPAQQRWRLVRQVGWVLALLAVLAMFCGFYPQLVAGLHQWLPPLRAFNLSRFHFLTPLLWFGVLVLGLRYLPSGRARGALVGLQLLIGLGMNGEWTANLRRVAGAPRPDEPTYAAYVAPDLFAQVRQAIAARTGQQPSQYRVACLGLPPAIAGLNGFYTLDAYLNNYLLAYKHQFRPLIAGELAKDEALRNYYDAWGSRCYLFSAELGKNFRVAALPERVVEHWAFDAQAFRRLGGRYVLSAARLARPAESGLLPLGAYSTPGAYWRIWLYQVGN